MAKAAVGQICSSRSMAHNPEQCVRLVAQAAQAGAKILFLPEASDYIGLSAADSLSLSLAEPEARSPFVLGGRRARHPHTRRDPRAGARGSPDHHHHLPFLPSLPALALALPLLETPTRAPPSCTTAAC
ncbi:hypothetical protein F4780DRAFT_751913 [Xylariomycetidae sp. FL0641]|nr:hypothetical protein F4780DRAFT_751913 [Xylariomycetidae sp. FL0641]